MTRDTWQMSQLILLSFVVVLDTDHHRVLILRLESLAQGDGIALEQFPFTLLWSYPRSGDGQLCLCLRVLSCEFSKGSLMLLQLFYICMKSLQICESIWENYYTWYFVWFLADSETMVTGLNQYWQEWCFSQKPAGWKSIPKIWKKWWLASMNTVGPGSSRSFKMVIYISVISQFGGPQIRTCM